MTCIVVLVVLVILLVLLVLVVLLALVVLVGAYAFKPQKMYKSSRRIGDPGECKFVIQP
jgi:hypothetical protein